MKHSGVGSTVTFSDVRALVAEERWDKRLIDGVDRFLGIAILLTPAVAGPAGVPALALLQPKDELIKIGRAALRRFASTGARDFVTRHRHLTAAYCMLTYTAFFEALDLELPELARAVDLSDEERQAIVKRATQTDPGAADAAAADRQTAVAEPHPTLDPDAVRRSRFETHAKMASAYRYFVQGLSIWDEADERQRHAIEEVIQAIPQRAAEVFEAEYLHLITEYPAFHRWAELYEFTAVRQLTADLSADLRHRLALVERAAAGIDLGLKNLSQLLAAGPPASVAISEQVRLVVDGLHREYADRIADPVIHDRYRERGTGATLSYPRKSDIFVPQAFQAVRYDDPSVRLELDGAWSEADRHEDVGVFLMRYLESAYSIEVPLLVLGHPGSGKSLLTEMIAARLAPPDYHPIRVELRDIDAEAELQDQIERQIRRDTGREINWATLADALGERPPIIILDGYDELLQASGKVFSSYLAKVQGFQRREAVQGRPVRIIVTSRITLIDKAVIPEGTTVVRLLEFDGDRRRRWTEVWNATNSAYFAETKVAPFALADDSPVRHLAEQPLLLLMLAVYDSAGNQLRDTDLDRTSLYHSLLVRFIERERTKGESADAFLALSPRERAEQIQRDLARLGVAAMGMFNRRSLHVGREDLDRDIAYFDLQQRSDVAHGRAMTEADLLLGSFFFIHESRSRHGTPADPRDAATAFEFLHNTFGEFLTADFILRRVIAESHAMRKMSGDSQLLAMREQRLGNLPADWFARLIYTSLHTRPVVLSMMREWLPHRLAAEGYSADEFEQDLALIVSRQLAEVLRGNAPPSIMQQVNDSPFDSLPVLGHLAVCALNLVLLQVNLAGEEVTLDETTLDVPLSDCRPWDRLVNLWRSWFSLDVLASVPNVLHARRTDGTVSLSLPDSEILVGISTLDDVCNVANALADNTTYGLAIPHLFDRGGVEDEELNDADNRLQSEGIDVSASIEARLLRRTGALPSRRALARALMFRIPGHLESDVATTMEVLERTALSPRQEEATFHLPSDDHPLVVLELSRYEATLVVDLKRRFAPPWLDTLLRGLAADLDIELLLQREAGAVLLAAAGEEPMFGGTRALAAAIDELVDRLPGLPDPFAAAALYLLGAAAGRAAICKAALKQLAGMLTAGSSLLDVPVPLLDKMLDHLVAMSRSRPDRDARVIADHLTREVAEMAGTLRHYWLLLIQACRLALACLPDPEGTRVLALVRNEDIPSSRWVNGRVLTVLVRLAREADDPALAFEALREIADVRSGHAFMQSIMPLLGPRPEGSATDPASREISDLRWLASQLDTRSSGGRGRPQSRRRKRSE